MISNPTPIFLRPLELFAKSLEAARNSEARGHLAGAELYYANAIQDLVSAATSEKFSPQEGILFLKSQGISALFQKHEQLVRETAETDELSIFTTVAVAHAASFLGEHGLAEYYVSGVQYQGRHFWNDYARAMQCLVTKQVYEPKLGRLAGYQKYWAVYLSFISDVTHGRELAPALDAMRDSFKNRNLDKRIVAGGAHLLEGSARQPVHWDFRGEALKAYVVYKFPSKDCT
jgi:hypothetical protein